MTKGEDHTVLILQSPETITMAVCSVCCAIICDSSPSARKGKPNRLHSDMYLLVGACGNRAIIAAREYVERYLECHLPNANVFHQLDQRMRESGNVYECHRWIEVGSTLTGHQR
jgi:hypothetical protein